MPDDFIFSNSLYLSLDQGGHASRAIVFNHRGELITEASYDVSTIQSQPNWVEHDPEDLLESIRKSISDVVASLGSRCQNIVAAGLATQRSNIVCWEKDSGTALTPIISWQDRRAHRWLQQFAPKAEQLHKVTGLFLSAHYGASKLRWCLDHVPRVQECFDNGNLCFGPMASFLTHQLLDEKPLLVDPVNASRTQLFNLKTQDWDAELLDLFGIPREPLPRCVPTHYGFGQLPLGDITVPLRIVTGDQSAALYDYGELQPDTAYINAGTGAFLSRPSGRAQLYSRRLLTSVIHQDDEGPIFVLEGTVNGAGSALAWAEKDLGLSEQETLEQLSEWLSRTNPPPLFLNGVSGLGTPYWIPDFPSQFKGEGKPWQKMVAVIESIIFLLQASLDEMEKLASPPEQIQISGGLAAQDGLCQRLADLSNLPVYRPVKCEATARGTAYLLAGSPRVWPETEPGQWFEPSENKLLKQRYEDWQAAMLEVMRNLGSDSN